MDNKDDSGVNFLLVRSGKMEIQLYILSRDRCLDYYILFGDVYARSVFSYCLYFGTDVLYFGTDVLLRFK